MEKIKCCICNEYFEGFGNNPAPLIEQENARCCDECNNMVVLFRIQKIQVSKKISIDVELLADNNLIDRSNIDRACDLLITNDLNYLRKGLLKRIQEGVRD